MTIDEFNDLLHRIGGRVGSVAKMVRRAFDPTPPDDASFEVAKLVGALGTLAEMVASAFPTPDGSTGDQLVILGRLRRATAATLVCLSTTRPGRVKVIDATGVQLDPFLRLIPTLYHDSPSKMPTEWGGQGLAAELEAMERHAVELEDSVPNTRPIVDDGWIVCSGRQLLAAMDQSKDSHRMLNKRIKLGQIFRERTGNAHVQRFRFADPAEHARVKEKVDRKLGR